MFVLILMNFKYIFKNTIIMLYISHIRKFFNFLHCKNPHEDVQNDKHPVKHYICDCVINATAEYQ